MYAPEESEPISLDDLPRHSSWPHRILGVEEWEIPNRDIEKIEEEYDADKYKTLFEFVTETGTRDPFEVKRCQNSNREWQFLDDVTEDQWVCSSESTDLFVAPVHAAQAGNDAAVIDVFRDVLDGGETLVELGSGYGYNLNLLRDEFPGCEFLGGEYAENAIEIANHLYEGQGNVAVKPFNYYADEWPLLEAQDEEVVVFTRLSVEQLPTCAEVIETLVGYQNAVREVIHLEPVYELHGDDSLLQLLRKKYIEINDYNRDLLSVLEGDDRIDITTTEYDVYGFNGLNPMSLVRWRPR